MRRRRAALPERTARISPWGRVGGAARSQECAAPFAARPAEKEPRPAGGFSRLLVAPAQDFRLAISTDVATCEVGLLRAVGDLAAAWAGVPPLSLLPTFSVPVFIIRHVIAVLVLHRAQSVPDLRCDDGSGKVGASSVTPPRH